MTQKQKILLAFILPAIVALACIAFSLERSFQHLAVERWSVEHKALVRSISQAMQQQITEARSLLTYTSQLDEFSKLLATAQIDRSLNGIPPGADAGKRRMLDALLSKTDTISTVFILLPNGDHYLSHPYDIQLRLKKYNLADRPYFQEATRTHLPAVSDSLIGSDGNPAVVVDVPLLDSRGEIFAHLGAVVLLQHLADLVEAERIAPFDAGMLVDRQGKLLAHTDPTQIGPESQFFAFQHPLLPAPQENGNEVRFARWTDSQGTAWLSFVQRMENGWSLVLQRRLDSVLAEYRDAVWQNILLVALILFASGSIGLTMAFIVARRWEAADQALNKARSELESRVAERTAELASSEKEVARSRDFYLSVLESFPALIWRSGLDSRCDYFNRTWLDFTGRSLGEELGNGWSKGVHPEDRPLLLERFQQSFKHRLPFSLEHRLRRHDGEYRWLINIGRPFHDINGEFIGYLGACFDVTERHAADEQLRLIASVFSHAREGIIITDARTRIIDVNEAFTEITGYSRQESIGRKPNFLRSDHQTDAFYEAIWRNLDDTGYWQGEIWNRRKNGELYAELLTISGVRDGKGLLSHYVGIFADITLQKEHEQRLEKLAHFDPLTELPNRTLLGDRLHMSIALAQRTQRQLAVCLLDLDGFKQVNDRLGHAAGDLLLIEFSQRMRRELRQSDTLARLGGDEFVVLINDLESYEECIDAVRRIIESARQPFVLNGEPAKISTSIGITIFPDDGADPDLLLRHADQAMYIAKQGGGNRYFMFDPFKDIAARAERTAIDRMEQALHDGEFELHYQPKVDMRLGTVIGAEALIRWRHPERGLVMPNDFLPLIEDTDFAITLGEWVIRDALTQLDTWFRAGVELCVSVNVSPRHLQLPDFALGLADQLACFPMLPSRLLELEILETTALHDTTHAAEVIAACRRLGVSFALDDFGTGYSSLLYLKHLPADTLKIDQSFVRAMLDDSENTAIVKGVIGLAQAFNRKVIAEGVESVRHGRALLEQGCSHGQGYGIARPMPAGDLAAWIEAWKAPEIWRAYTEPPAPTTLQ
jgi:diguanylate cyclase (GGDEF)-like protein/PAS domain S-box-containing protein